jgi:hypothetical protein
MYIGMLHLGRMEEAFELHKKQEALCLELGNRSGLAYCFWFWGLLAREQRDSKDGTEKAGFCPLYIYRDEHAKATRRSASGTLEDGIQW